MKKLLLLCCLCVALSGCQGQGSVSEPPSASETTATATEPQTTTIYAMDTVMDVSVYTEDAAVLDEASALVTDLENRLSTTKTDSEISRLNHEGQASLSEDTALLMDKALHFCEKTDGALDISIYPVVRTWGFTTGEYKVPRQEELASLLANVDYQKINFSKEDRAASLPGGMEVDLGSVAKGYTSDRLIQLFRDNGATSALVNLGGNVQALGTKPDGSPWRVGIQDPHGESYIGVLDIDNQAVITSGGYERFFKGEDGTIYWHIIDPATGAPAKNGLISATAVGDEGAYCDALSTSLFIMGPDKAIDFWRAHQDFEMILITEDNELLITPTLSKTFQLQDDAPYKMTVINHD